MFLASLYLQYEKYFFIVAKLCFFYKHFLFRNNSNLDFLTEIRVERENWAQDNNHSVSHKPV